MTTARILSSLSHTNPRTFLSIIDAKDLGLGVTQTIVNRIFNISFSNDSLKQLVRTPDSFIRESYFSKNPIEAPRAGHILLAELNNEICGFIITNNYRASFLPPEIAEVSWLAVDPNVKRNGVGTALLIEAMRKAKEAGKTELTASYRAPGQLKDTDKDQESSYFYASFAKKYGIQKSKPLHHDMARGSCKICYDLSYDFNQLPQFMYKRLWDTASKAVSMHSFGTKLASGSAHLWPYVSHSNSLSAKDQLRANSILREGQASASNSDLTPSQAALAKIQL